MKTYPVVEITFSPTGGTKKVADLISCYLGNITNTQQVQSIKIISEPAIAANVSVVWDVSPPVQKVSGS